MTDEAENKVKGGVERERGTDPLMGKFERHMAQREELRKELWTFMGELRANQDKFVTNAALVKALELVEKLTRI